MSEKTCMNCGTVGCDRATAMTCSNGRSLWEPKDNTPFMTYRDECAQLRAQVAALTEKNERLTNEGSKLAAGQCIVKNGLLGDECGNQYCTLTAALGKARDELVHVKDVMLREVGMSIVDMNVIAAIDGVLNNNDISTPATDALGEKGDSQ